MATRDSSHPDSGVQPQPGPAQKRIRSFIRWFVALVVITYGMAKLNNSQFEILDSELDRPMGEVSGFWLTWYYFGYSKIYGNLIALAQIAGGLMLTFRRTALLGTLILLPIVTNIVLVDLFYGVDFGATLVAVILEALLLFLLAPHSTQLLNTILLPAAPRSLIGSAARALIVAVTFGFTWYTANVVKRHPTRIDGVWRPDSAAAVSGIETIFFERNRAFLAVFKSKGDYTSRYFEIAPNNTIRVWERWPFPQPIESRGQQVYEGTIESDSLIRLWPVGAKAAGSWRFHRR